jgi:tetratricopeptide (TPR) repeat protein
MEIHMPIRFITSIFVAIIVSGCAASNTKATDMARLTRDAGQAYASGNCNEAMEKYLQLVAKVPNETGTLLKIANCTYFQGDSAGAVEQYKQILIGAPDYRAAWFNLTHVQMRELAATLSKLVESINPSSPEEFALVNRALMLLQTYNENKQDGGEGLLESNR